MLYLNPNIHVTHRLFMTLQQGSINRKTNEKDLLIKNFVSKQKSRLNKVIKKSLNKVNQSLVYSTN